MFDPSVQLHTCTCQFHSNCVANLRHAHLFHWCAMQLISLVSYHSCYCNSRCFGFSTSDYPTHEFLCLMQVRTSLQLMTSMLYDLKLDSQRMYAAACLWIEQESFPSVRCGACWPGSRTILSECEMVGSSLLGGAMNAHEMSLSLSS